MLFLLGNVCSSQTTTVGLTTISRPSPKVGHMLNYLTKPSWENQSFIDSVQKLSLEIIRYPGGTESQYFDWQTGKSLPSTLWTNGTLFNHAYIGTVPHVSYPLSELLYFYQQTNIKPIFCLNLLTRSLPNQIEMLQTASTLGIPVEWIELGNELYFEDQDFILKYPNPIDYVLDIKNNWIPQLNALFPNAKIAVIGGFDGQIDLNNNSVPPRISSWNSTLFEQNVSTDAITFHYYIPPNTTTLSNPILSQALAAPFRHWPTLKTNTLDNITNGMECWITEYNLNDGNQTTYAIASSWAHGLYTASLFSLMLEEPKVTMLLNHQIAGSPAFASLASYTPFGDTLTNRLTAEGNAMRLLHKAVKGSLISTKLHFSNNPTIVVGNTTYPSLLGWYFENGSENELYILNLSATSFTMDLSGLFNTEFEYEQISADNPLLKNITTQNLNISKGINQSTLQSSSYSLTYIKTENVASIDDDKLSKRFVVYPQPVKDKVILHDKNVLNNNTIAIQITDIQGRVLDTVHDKFQNGLLIIDLSTFSKQMLFLNILDFNGKKQTIKVLKE